MGGAKRKTGDGGRTAPDRLLKKLRGRNVPSALHGGHAASHIMKRVLDKTDAICLTLSDILKAATTNRTTEPGRNTNTRKYSNRTTGGFIRKTTIQQHN